MRITGCSTSACVRATATDARSTGFRPIIIPCVLEKLSFAVAVAWLYAQGRVPSMLCFFAAIDFSFAVLFIMAFRYLGRLN